MINKTRYFFIAVVLLLGLIGSSCKSSKKFIAQDIYASKTLQIEQITPNVYVHKSYLESRTFGKVSCNGLIYNYQNEVIVFDTPSDNATSEELIEWIETQLTSDIKAVVINHFHVDCLGGLKAFHDKHIPSYGNIQTQQLAKDEGFEVPTKGFEEMNTILIGDQVVTNYYLGQGHTMDNIVSHLPSEDVLFGGCMIKSIGARKGNLSDASVQDWPETVTKVRTKFPDLKWVVPGHGKVGGPELLDYTIELFNEINRKGDAHH